MIEKKIAQKIVDAQEALYALSHEVAEVNWPAWKRDAFQDNLESVQVKIDDLRKIANEPNTEIEEYNEGEF